MDTLQDSHRVKTMMDELLSHVVPLLPLRIQEVEWNDPVLTISGPGWALAIVSPWRIVADSRLVYGWVHPAVEDLVWDLCGQSIVKIGVQSSLAPVDPVLHLSSGGAIEIFSQSGIDPWTLHLPEMTFVGSPTA